MLKIQDGGRATVATEVSGPVAETLSHRELRNQSAEVLRRVQAGATYEITNHGTVVAVISPVPMSDEAGLRIRPAKRRGGFGSWPRHHLDRPVQESLDALRSDR